ncbi:formylmethanofuran dehydrogenase subunit A [Tautonia sociabilis]|uniref:Formylmethanofuran dehydrogenase subunit A n=1 Tax=Tautonia sociabilis TaxID=2080755 RepID=A0A432MNH1_9BACT|nr:formylmethanofuran dehydrogenase subunit A [Tautonia sociabilis]RUL88656.1 formylmethanofuran dehydrogenase subunit A [Tautonia sociabilis]
MPAPTLRILGGTVYDPIHDIDGQTMDLWVADGRLVPPPDDPSTFSGKTIDARGYAVMPGGIDMHCHVAGPKVNAGRLMSPASYRETPGIPRSAATRSGLVGRVPTTSATGHLFAGIGYTTAMDAAIPPLHARAAHDELRDTPILDNGFYVLLGNAHRVLDCAARGDQEALDAYAAWALDAAKGFALKVVNPGDVEDYKQVSRKAVRELDEDVTGFGASPRQVVVGLAAAADHLGLPHPVHIHCNNLGIPGNWRTTLATMQALDGRRGHFAHIQFHSYDGDPADPRSFSSAVPKLLDYVRRHPELTLDVGHVSPGPAMILTGDPRAGDRLHRQLGAPWYNADIEQESSCGVIPIEYLPQKNLIAAVQWAIALEWYLLMDDPWRLALTSDHPNGGAFYRYPEMISLLMDRAFRAEALATMPKGLRDRSVIHELDREYSLFEIAILTRAAPARMLGLDARKGHLGPGADADIAIYSPNPDRRAMFERPRWVLKAGELVVDDGLVVSEPAGRTFTVSPEFDPGRLPAIRAWFERDYSIRFANYAIPADDLPAAEVVSPRRV